MLKSGLTSPKAARVKIRAHLTLASCWTICRGLLICSLGPHHQGTSERSRGFWRAVAGLLFTVVRGRDVLRGSDVELLRSFCPCLPLEGAAPKGASTRWHSASPSCSDARALPAAPACTRAALASPRGPPTPGLSLSAFPGGVAQRTH